MRTDHKSDNAIPQKKNTRRLHISLLSAFLTLVCVASIIVIVFPYIPKIVFLLRRPSIRTTELANAAQSKSLPTNTNYNGNRLILPSIGINTQIIDGKSIDVIGKNQGVWRETNTVSPEQPGNLVIAGHRFLYSALNGGQFYNLPEIKIGEKLYVIWNSRTYEYSVYNTQEVLPNQIDIRDYDPDAPAKLTLYTCFPLGSTAKRYVLEAKLVE